MLVQRASDWLESHADFELLSCETVQQRWHLTETLLTDQLLLKKDPDSVCHFVKGFRFVIGQCLTQKGVGLTPL